MTDCLSEFCKRYPVLTSQAENIELAAKTIIQCYENNGKLIACGNGGSASDSAHIVGELMKGFIKKRKLSESMRIHLQSNNPNISNEMLDSLQIGLPAINLSENSAFNTAFANDVSPDMLFAQGVYGYGKINDVFLGITTSGNSKNVVTGAEIAKGMGLKTIGLTGRDGGKLSEICDICIIAPETETYKIQELHLPIYHQICIMVEEKFFKE